MIGTKGKTPLDEVKNVLAPLKERTGAHLRADSKVENPFPPLQTPINRNISKLPKDYQPSAMKGVVFTATGETVATPSPAELANLFVNSPKVGLNFAKIFDFDEHSEDGSEGEEDTDAEGPPSPSVRKSDSTPTQQAPAQSSTAPPSRLRRPSIRRSVTRPGPTSDPTGASSPAVAARTAAKVKRSTSSHSGLAGKSSVTVPQSSPPAPEYDFSDEENLPSPFLKRVERERAALPGGATLRTASKRPSSGNLLRAVAAVNAANAGTVNGSGGGKGTIKASLTRPAVTSARKASEEARKALLRP